MILCPPGIFRERKNISPRTAASTPPASPTTDANGNVTNDGNHAYTWNADGMMASVDVTTKITYDALGRAVEIEHSGSFTQIVYSPAGGKLAVMNGQTLVKALVRLPLGATAVYNSSGLAYIRHSDHLGSSRLATTPARTMYASAAYAPYGEAYAVQSAVQGATDLSFTGQDQDTTSGMYDFMVRKYNPVQGRWLSPDPAGLGAVDPANPQTWNRYAYVGNNPLSLIDPLGADAYEGCDRNLQPWCFEGSWTAWIQGLNGMSGWGDPFRLGSIPVKVYVPGVYTRPVPLGGDTSLAIQNGVLRVQFFIPGEYVPGHYVTIGNAFTLLGPSIGQQLANNAKAASNLPTVSTNRPRDEWKPATSTTFLGKYGVQLACEFSVAVADWADNDVAAFGGFAGMAVGYLREAPVPAVGGLLLFARVTVGTALRARSTCVPIAWGPGHF